MKIIYIDDSNEFEPLIVLACERLTSMFRKTVTYVSVSPAAPKEARDDLPVLMDDEGELITKIRQVGQVSPADLIWRSQLAPLIAEDNNVYLLDINFGSLLPDYGLQIAQYLDSKGVSFYRILLFSNFPSHSYGKADKHWRFTFDKRDFRFQNEIEKEQAAAKLADQIVGLFREEIVDASAAVAKSPEIIGDSAALEAVISDTNAVINSSATVIIMGETGTGKELLANLIHFNSPRKDKNYVKVNCGAIPENLLESELFGHERGAFTDARVQRKGVFETANGGTLFLDEIGEMSTSAQVRLLRVLQDGEFTRVGGSEVLKVDVRVIAATHVDLGQAVADGKFRGDLFYRISTFPIRLPALRDRTTDIPKLADHFLAKFSKKHGRGVTKIDAVALSRLVNDSWPGNIRELENTIERAVLLAKADTILPEDLRLEDTRNLLHAERGWEDLEIQIKENNPKRQFSAAFNKWVRMTGVNGKDAEELVWQTVLMAMKMSGNAKHLVRNERGYHSIRIIIALLDSLSDSSLRDSLDSEMLKSLFAISGSTCPPDYFNSFKTNGHIANLGSSTLGRWTDEDKQLLLNLIRDRLIKRATVATL